MQKLANKRNKGTEGEAMEMKLKLAANLVEAYTKGDEKKCIKIDD